jgi:hypothetical protein
MITEGKLREKFVLQRGKMVKLKGHDPLVPKFFATPH